MGGYFSRLGASINIAVTLNRDKSSKKKAANNREVGMDLLRMYDRDVLKALGVWDAVEAKTDEVEKLNIILSALKKRD